MILASDADITLVPRFWRMYLALWLISRCRLPATPALIRPDAVSLKRFLAPDLVFNFGISHRSRKAPSSKKDGRMNRPGMPWARRFDGAGASRGKRGRRQGRQLYRRETAIVHTGRRFQRWRAAVSITTTRFGRRSVASPSRGPAKPDIWASQDAAAALGAATGWNRTPATPSLSSLPPAEPLVDEWRPRAAPAAAATPTAPTPNLMALLFSSQGRMRRRDYWLVGSLSLTALSFSLPLQPALIGALPVAAVYVRIRSCLGTKRWHDRDKSGVWNL